MQTFAEAIEDAFQKAQECSEDASSKLAEERYWRNRRRHLQKYLELKLASPEDLVTDPDYRAWSPHDDVPFVEGSIT